MSVAALNLDLGHVCTALNLDLGQVRGKWLMGPLDLIIDFRAPQSRGGAGLTRVRTGLLAVQFDTLTSVDRFGAQMSDFNIVRSVTG